MAIRQYQIFFHMALSDRRKTPITMMLIRHFNRLMPFVLQAQSPSRVTIRHSQILFMNNYNVFRFHYFNGGPHKICADHPAYQQEFLSAVAPSEPWNLRDPPWSCPWTFQYRSVNLFDPDCDPFVILTMNQPWSCPLIIIVSLRNPTWSWP